ncbi:ATP-binding protein [Pannus brasiliensis CCIBt3594]|uniref:Circadian input-output histidine kinase CikA n=1 Tax=Pannus brasiliensis CCIBt3594 TaxID=1427578 RepID=A0AAW9QPB2_9CHRO
MGQSSFRRILLSRLLLVSVPVLLMGVYVTYRKARSAFLETARQNLTESAIRKADGIHQKIEILSANLLSISESAVLEQESLPRKKEFLRRTIERFPIPVDRVTLLDIGTGRPLFQSSPVPVPTAGFPIERWRKLSREGRADTDDIFIQNVLPAGERGDKAKNHQLELLFAAPVYNSLGKLQQVLIWQASPLYGETVRSGTLSGYPVVIAQNGTILAHPYGDRIGRHIDREADASRLKSIIENAIQGRRDFLHLFSFERDGEELVAGYSAIPSPITGESGEKWVVLAVSTVNTALAPLGQIWETIFYLVSALSIASLIAILLIARELARPLEKLRDYAINTDNIHFKQPLPRDFHIREINQLSSALEEMIGRLRDWGEEIVLSWKEAQNANRLKNEFLATTSHELRTPLNGIIGCIRCVKDGLCDSEEEAREFLQQADGAAVHLLGIINDILDIAKIEAGKQSVNLEIVNLHDIITEVVSLQGIQIQHKKLRLTVRESRQNLKIYADPAKFKQVILNVLSNATKFTEIGEISISTEARDDRAVVTVIDTGIGIAPSQQSRLFRPFVMIDGSTTRKFGGTGLGLAISKNLMELMGGDISLFSEGKGFGTKVEVTIPLAEREANPIDLDNPIAPEVPVL